MRLFQWLTDLSTGSSTPPGCPIDEGPRINPATGLPMVTPGIGGVDVGGQLVANAPTPLLAVRSGMGGNRTALAKAAAGTTPDG